MTTTLYIHSRSFAFREGVTISLLSERIEELAQVMAKVMENGDIVYKQNIIYEVLFYEQMTLCDVLYTDHQILGRDKIKYLQKIMDQAKLTELMEVDLIAKLKDCGSQNRYGFICLHEVNDIEKVFLISCEKDWYGFHRFFLGLFTISENEFAEEIGKYFEKIFFHPGISNSLNTLNGGLAKFKKAIVRHLTALNDEFRKYITHDRVMSLRQFSSACNIDVTLEGDVDRKSAFTFSFINEKGLSEAVCCEPHMKLDICEEPGDTRYYYNRIYFHEGKSNISNGRILVGHIGQHL